MSSTLPSKHLACLWNYCSCRLFPALSYYQLRVVFFELLSSADCLSRWDHHCLCLHSGHTGSSQSTWKGFQSKLAPYQDSSGSQCCARSHASRPPGSQICDLEPCSHFGLRLCCSSAEVACSLSDIALSLSCRIFCCLWLEVVSSVSFGSAASWQFGPSSNTARCSSLSRASWNSCGSASVTDSDSVDPSFEKSSYSVNLDGPDCASQEFQSPFAIDPPVGYDHHQLCLIWIADFQKKRHCLRP